MLQNDSVKISKQYKGQRNNSADHFQTDPAALDPLIPFIFNKSLRLIWEPACGKGNLVKGLQLKLPSVKVVGTDILHGGLDFLTHNLAQDYDCIITNPPYTLKDEFLQRCYDLGKPFALLFPLTAFDSKPRRLLFKKHGVEVIFLPRRVNFETPNGEGSSSWFATAWFTNGFNIGKQITFSDAEAA